MSICLIDSSILCEILRIPNKCGNHEAIYAQLQQKIATETLLLPMSAIVETGNHIGQIRDGSQRWSSAQNFVQFVKQALQGISPFTATPLFDRQEALLQWLEEFPEWTKSGSGLGDFTIFKEFERQCTIFPMRRVYIWSNDGHLSSYDRQP